MNDMTRRRFLGTAGAGLAVAAVAGTGLRSAFAADKIKITNSDALLVIDVQNCFTPGGSLAVKEGDAIVPLINKIAMGFQNVVLTQDWHTSDHVSFASQHDGKKPFETVQLPYGTQVLWPDHCVQGTEGAAIHKDINIPQAELIIRKGFHKDVDSYSAFLEADRKTQTGLAGYLHGRGIKRVFVCGLATDFCVAWSALDARKFKFQAVVIEDACRGIDINGSVAAAWKNMTKAGVKRIQSSDLELA
jgi:nicotinamidase/pyrazinamidase